MARRKLKSATDQRHFSMIYHDSLDSDLLKGVYEKMLFIALKRYADSNNQCFPSIQTLAKITGMSKRQVIDKLKVLEQKGIIRAEKRYREDGGYSSNIYTLFDYAEMWNSDNEDVAAVVDQYEENRMVDLLKAKGYKITKEKEPDNSEPTKVTEVPSTQFNQFDIVNTTLNSDKSQVERYTIDQIRQFYDYDILIHDNPYSRSDIDSVMDILHTNLNTTKPTIRISGEDKPTMVVISKLMKLTYSGIMYAIEKFKAQTERITNPRAYMLTILYHAEEQMNLDIANQVSHDMANWNPPTE